MKLIRLRYMFRFFIITFTLLASMRVLSVEVKDLYQAKIEVSSQSKGQRSRAFKKALAAVIVKVSGQESAVNNETIKKALVAHQEYLSQYSYDRINDKLVLLASFNENKVNQLFKQADLSLWGSLRPQILLWLIEEQGLSRTILSESSSSQLPLFAGDYAKQRGLPIIMPLMDLTDASQIQTSDIWGRFVKPIRAASQRYYPEAIVVIRISNSSLLPQSPQPIDETDCSLLCQQNNFVLDWSLLTDQQVFSEQNQSNDRKALIEDALSAITQTIYQGYAQSTNSNNELILDVANIDSLKTYMAVTRFLEKLTSVQSIQLVSAKGTNRRFSLILQGGKNSLLASLKLNKLLHQQRDPLAEILPDDIPVFYWGKL